MPLAFGDEAGDHHYVKDSVITTKVNIEVVPRD
jgi:hypothetical protein